jgi:hypothetical protein
VGERGRKKIHQLIEKLSKREVNERGRKGMVNWGIERIAR